MKSVAINIKPIGKRILVRKCITGEKRADGFYLGGIAITDLSADACAWAEIIDVADDCKLFRKENIGSFVYLPAWKPGYINKVDESDFTVKESLFSKSPKDGGANPLIYIG